MTWGPHLPHPRPDPAPAPETLKPSVSRAGRPADNHTYSPGDGVSISHRLSFYVQKALFLCFSFDSKTEHYVFYLMVSCQLPEREEVGVSVPILQINLRLEMHVPRSNWYSTSYLLKLCAALSSPSAPFPLLHVRVSRTARSSL